MRSLSAKRAVTAAVPSARSTSAVRCRVERGEGDGLGRFRLDPADPSGSGLDQPARGTGSEPEERGFFCRGGLRPPVAFLVLAGRVVGIVQDRAARLAAVAAGGLTGRSVFVDGGDDQLVAVETGPGPGVDQLVRNGAADRFDADRRFPGDPPGGGEGRGERPARQRVKTLPFLSELLGLACSGPPGSAGVDLLAEGPAAVSRSPKLLQSSRRFTSLATRSAFAIFTVDSEPPLVSGSAGTQVRMAVP